MFIHLLVQKGIKMKHIKSFLKSVFSSLITVNVFVFNGNNNSISTDDKD